MITIPKNLKPPKKFIEAVNKVAQKAETFLNINLHTYFTKHDISHCERIMERINNLIEGVKINLSPDEKFVLLCAIYLHDIGMQTEKYLTDEERQLDRNAQLEIIRNNHHIYSEKLIKESIQLDKTDKPDLALNDYRDYVDAIATVAKNHRKCELSKVESTLINNRRVNLQFLSALLILGDCLDISAQRIDIEKLKVLNVDVNSKLHWFTHYYVPNVEIDNQKITIHFKFPKGYDSQEKNLVSYFIGYVTDEVCRHLNLVYDVLFDNKIKLYKPIEVGKIEYSDTIVEPMPTELKNHIETKYKPQKGLGEIEAYWGKRNAANVSIEELLTKTTSSEIFIAALGFSTVKTLINDNVIDHLANLINKSSLKITIVYPKSVKQLQKFRPEFKIEDLTKKYDSGQVTIKTFKKRILEKCPNIEFEKNVEFRQYKDEIIPRHFLLQDNQSIFFGSYLVSELGGNSYLIKLNKNEDKTDDNKILNGLYEIFSNEIVSIIQNSTIVNNIKYK